VHVTSSIPYQEGAFAAIRAVADRGQRDPACDIRSESQMMCLDFLKIQRPSALRIDRREAAANCVVAPSADFPISSGQQLPQTLRHPLSELLPRQSGRTGGS